ncbi:MAG: dihydroorotate dehydrogenase electron transfer subunit [Actinobacteria bacterium]|nr:dihydroorotate dehydrogenase electron transfer subunit [Actinomycetota bacterium]
MKILSGEILLNRKYGEELYKMEIFSPYICKNALPGQFVNIKCCYEGMLDPLLRRPFGIYEIDKKFNVFSILYLVKGKGTLFLSKLKKGEILNFIGPLGNALKIKITEKNFLLVGGGIGVAPLCLIARSLTDQQKNVYFIAGFKDELFFNWESDLIKIVKNYRIFTENGSFGEKGLPTIFIKEHIDQYKEFNLICCGPREMLKAIQDILQDKNIPATVLMEEMMACGIGACMGCMIKIKEASNAFTYKRVCSDGPAFNLMEVVFD